jgi:hypothetical protein
VPTTAISAAPVKLPDSENLRGASVPDLLNAETLADARTGKNGRHRLAGLLIEDQDLTPYLRLRRPCDPDYCNFCNYWAWVAVPLALVG